MSKRGNIHVEWVEDDRGRFTCGQGVTKEQAWDDAQKRLNERNAFYKLPAAEQLRTLTSGDLMTQDLQDAVRLLTEIVLGSSAEEYVKKITEKYSFNAVANSVDASIMDCVDPNWEDDGYDCEFEWYEEFGRGEAEDDVIAGLLAEFKVPKEMVHEVTTLLKTKYLCLAY